MELKKHETFYRNSNGDKYFCTWVQHGDEVFDIKNVKVHG